MIYAISDIHGDYKQATKLLRQYNIINEDDQWIAGDSTLVVAGDSTDRGKDGIKVLRLLFNLTKQALEKGGRVIHLMGNHDALILCIALHNLDNDYDYKHTYVFKGNGGKMHEAVSLSRLHDLRHFVQSFPLMCRVGDILFQHADGFDLYNQVSGKGTPEEKIKRANQDCLERAESSWGAWNLFDRLTMERRWNHSGELMPDYLESFGAKLVVHGHTGFPGNTPKRYLDDMVINIDAVMSKGYRNDEERGCILVINRDGKDIVV
jgi:hypothetical protein